MWKTYAWLSVLSMSIRTHLISAWAFCFLQGRQIQGTFWRAQADKYYDIIQENKVYVFSKFQV